MEKLIKRFWDEAGKNFSSDLGEVSISLVPKLEYKIKSQKDDIDQLRVDNDEWKIQYEILTQKAAIMKDFITELIAEIKKAIETDGTCRLIVDMKTVDKAKKVIADKMPEYHNPCDIELLKKVTYEFAATLDTLAMSSNYKSRYTENLVKEALSFIEKQR